MNILPFVFAFLLTFSYLSFSFMRESRSAQMIEFTLNGYNHTDKAIRNGIIRKGFDKIKGTETSCLIPKEKAKQNPSFVSRRTSFPPLETSKFYVRALLSGASDLPNHPLYEPLAALLRELYQDRLFHPLQAAKGIEYELIASLVQKMNEQPSSDRLADLFPSNKELHTLYYKMIRGTNRYSKQEGIPPLDHFISLEKSDKVIHLNLTSETVLEALFGNAIKNEILQKEKEQFEATQKRYAFSKQDFQMLLDRHPKEQSLLLQLEPFISYTKKVGKKERLARRDLATQIGIEKEL